MFELLRLTQGFQIHTSQILAILDLCLEKGLFTDAEFQAKTTHYDGIVKQGVAEEMSRRTPSCCADGHLKRHADEQGSR